MANDKTGANYQVKERIKFREIFGYGLGDFAANIVCGMTTSFATYYYTNSLGMAAAAVGTMFMLSRIFDGISDIIMGLIIDRTRSKYGKARPWILWMAIPFAIAVVLLFSVPQSFSPTGKLIYAYITYNFFTTIVYTAVNQAYGTLNVMITDNPQDRAKLSISRMSMAMIAAILVSSIVMPLVAVFGGDSKAWTMVAAIMGIISVALLMITFATTRERIGMVEEEDKEQKEQVPIGMALKALFMNKYWINRILFSLAIAIATMTTAANIYYAQYWLGNKNLTGVLTIANAIPMIFALGFVNFFIKRIGNRNTSLLGAVIMAVGFVIQFIAPANYTLILIGAGIRGFGTGLASTVFSVMLGDTIDYGEWKFGIRTDGLIFSASSFGTKVGAGIATASLGWALEIGHFDPNVAIQNTSALNAIKFVYIVLPMLATIFAIILNLTFNLDKKMPQIKNDLRERKAQAGK